MQYSSLLIKQNIDHQQHLKTSTKRKIIFKNYVFRKRKELPFLMSFIFNLAYLLIKPYIVSTVKYEIITKSE